MTSDGKCYSYETGAKDDAQNIRLILQPPTLYIPGVDKISVKSVQAMTTDQGGVAGQISRTGALSGTTALSTLACPGAGAWCWLSDVSQAKAVRDGGVDVLMTWSVSYPFVVREATVDLSGEGSRGPSAG